MIIEKEIPDIIIIDDVDNQKKKVHSYFCECCSESVDIEDMTEHVFKHLNKKDLLKTFFKNWSTATILKEGIKNE